MTGKKIHKLGEYEIYKRENSSVKTVNVLQSMGTAPGTEPSSLEEVDSFFFFCRISADIAPPQSNAILFQHQAFFHSAQQKHFLPNPNKL